MTWRGVLEVALPLGAALVVAYMFFGGGRS
jgi:hypothetical protein